MDIRVVKKEYLVLTLFLLYALTITGSQEPYIFFPFRGFPRALEHFKDGGIKAGKAKWILTPGKSDSDHGGVRKVGKSEYSWLLNENCGHSSASCSDVFGTRLLILRSSKNAGAGLIFGCADNKEFYCVELSPALHLLTIFSNSQGKRDILLSKNVKIDYDQWIKLRISLENNSIQVYMDNFPILDQPLSLPHESQVCLSTRGVFTRGNVDAVFSYFYSGLGAVGGNL